MYLPWKQRYPTTCLPLKEEDKERIFKSDSHIPTNAFRVLITGFGPFMHYDQNPSWLAVQPLQNKILQTNITPHKVEASNIAATSAASKSTSTSSTTAAKISIPPIAIPSSPRPIHITTLQIPVLYDAVLDSVPPLYARPPVLPADAPQDTCTPPPNGFDFVFHIGVAGRGPLRMERVGHKLGYHMKDASGKYAPVVKVVPKDFSRREQGGDPAGSPAAAAAAVAAVAATAVVTVGGGTITVGQAGASVSSFITVNGAPLSPIESLERERGMGLDDAAFGGYDTVARPTRGFGVGYESLQDEYTTDVDVSRLVSDMKKEGIEQIYSSMDAGHYICDFTYYCSLAEVARAIKPYEEKRRTPQVLFLHCPPVNQPLSTEEVTEALKKIVIWVCGEILIQSLRDEAAVAAGVASDAPLPAPAPAPALGAANKSALKSA